jgi:hypothetical protein
MASQVLIVRRLAPFSMKRLILKSSNDEHISSLPYVVLNLNEEVIGNIKELSEQVKRCGHSKYQILFRTVRQIRIMMLSRTTERLP